MRFPVPESPLSYEIFPEGLSPSMTDMVKFYLSKDGMECSVCKIYIPAARMDYVLSEIVPLSKWAESVIAREWIGALPKNPKPAWGSVERAAYYPEEAARERLGRSDVL